MWDKFIGEQVRRANRNLLITNAVILIFAGTMMLSQHKTISGYVRGGQRVEPEALAGMTVYDGVVDVTSDNVIPTGYEMVKTHDSGRKEVEYEYLAMKAGDKLLIVKAKPGQHGPHFEGAIAALPSDVSTALMRDVTSASVRQALMPVMLDTIEYKDDGMLL